MITRKEWLKQYKNCPAKLYAHGISIGQHTQNLTPHGHFMCAEEFPFGRRCMYKTCDKLKRIKGE